MADNQIESGANVDENGVDYVEAIKQLRDTTVSKDAYDKLKSENKRLLDSLVRGETIEQPAEAVDVTELRKELFSGDVDMSNLEYMEKVMQLRDAIVEAGGTDPFLPYGKKIIPTDEDIATADRVAETIKECIEYAEGDSAVFTNELQRRMVDTSKGNNVRR